MMTDAADKSVAPAAGEIRAGCPYMQGSPDSGRDAACGEPDRYRNADGALDG